MKTTGGGLLAIFDCPTRAARCAAEVTRSVRAIDLEIRVGLHTGEVELRYPLTPIRVSPFTRA